jgi:aconitate hydratase
VIAQSYERIHRSNLVGMGVLPLQFKAGESPAVLGLDGTETYSTQGVADDVTPHETILVTATRADGTAVTFETLARIDSNVETTYYRNGGILQTVLRRLMAS